jgi:hypothetical protein
MQREHADAEAPRAVREYTYELLHVPGLLESLPVLAGGHVKWTQARARYPAEDGEEADRLWTQYAALWAGSHRAARSSAS